MLRFYWDNVYRSHVGLLALIIAMALLSGIFLVGSLSMVIPILGMLMNDTYDLSSISIPLVGRLAAYMQQLPKTQLLIVLFGLAGGMLILKDLFLIVHQYVAMRLLTKVRLSLTTQLFQRHLSTSYFVHVNQAKGTTMNNVWAPPVDVAETIRAGANMIAAILQATGMTLLMLAVSWQLTLTTIVIFVPVALLMDRFFKTRLRLIGERSYELIANTQALMGDIFDGIRHVKAYRAEAQILERFGGIMRKIFHNETAHARLRYLPAPLLETLAVILVLLLLLLSSAVPFFRLEFAYFVAFILALQRLNPVVSTIVESKMALDRATKMVEVVSRLMKDLPDEENDGQLKPPERVASVVLHDVSFSYPSRPDLTVLDGLSLELKTGEVTALVGPTGAGKSTIADLIIRLFRPSKGTIRADGTDIYDFDLFAWREQVAFVSQDVFLFNTTIRDNISMAKPNAPIEEIARVCRLARIDAFVNSLPQGIDTVVGDRGVKLSGGQRQRVAIARALLADASLLIFDEATSALDSQTERAIQETIEGLRRDRIVLIIAHRLSTIVNADNIVVLEHGRVVEKGDHAALLAKKGRYWDLYSTAEQAQMSPSLTGGMVTDNVCEGL